MQSILQCILQKWGFLNWGVGALTARLSTSLSTSFFLYKRRTFKDDLLATHFNWLIMGNIRICENKGK